MPTDLVTGAAYTADRAAALAGIPLSTLHYWSRSGIWVPSVSQTRVKRWSYGDLLALRLIDWLRRDKPEAKISGTSMKKIRLALSSVEEIGEGLKDLSVRVKVDALGRVFLEVQGQTLVPLGRGYAQRIAGSGGIKLIEEWQVHEEVRGPHLLVPKPSLRIVPGKLSGEPHPEGTRIPSRILWSLSQQGLDTPEIIELYPRLTEQNVREAIALEDELEYNLGRAA